MKKRLLIYTFALIAAFSMPMLSRASQVAFAGIEQVADDEISISVNENQVTVTGAQGQTMEVVSLTGRKVITVKIESPAQRIELNIPKGCYIIKIGKVVRKVSIH